MNVLLTAGTRAHTAYREIIRNPPPSVHFIVPDHQPVENAGRAIAPLLRAFGVPSLGVVPAVSEHVDLVHSSQRLLVTRCPWVVDIEHGQPFVGIRVTRFGWPLTRRSIKAVLHARSCRAILPWSDTAARAFRAALGGDDRIAAKIHVIHPAVAVPPLEPRGPHEGPCRVLFVANAPDYNAILKGGRELLAAFTVLKEQGVDLSLTIVGPVPDSFRQRCIATPGVTLAGLVSRERLSELYQGADVYAMPTLSDTFGMVFLEAMASGLPVVALDRPYTNEIVRSGETGLLVPMPRSAVRWADPDGRLTLDSDEFIRRVLASATNDEIVRGLVQALGTLARDEGLRRNLGGNALAEVVLGRFSVSRRSDALARVYDAAAAHRE